MSKLFDDARNYQQNDPEIIDLLGNASKQAQMRYYGRSPSYYLLGRKVIYRGSDLNVWAEAQRHESLIVLGKQAS